MTPSRFALSYVALGVLALALFAIPLWHGYRANVGTFRAYVPGEEMQRLADIFHRDGATALARAIESQARSAPRDQVLLFAAPSKELLAGNLSAWPPEVPDAPGAYGLVISTGGGQSTRVVASYVRLAGGYHLLMGRESVRFESLVERFWYGIAGAVAIVLALGAAFAWLLRRTLLSEVNQISRTASAIVEGDRSRRLPASAGSGELDTLAQTVNGMLGELARSQDELEAQVAQRTAQLKESEGRFALAVAGAQDGIWDWDVSSGMIYISPRAQEIIMGRAADGVDVRHADEWARHYRLHPDDAPRREAAVREHFKGRTPYYEGEWRVLHPDGTYHWVHSRGICTRDASGRAVRFAGSSTDIDARKRTEEALRRSRERYALAVQAAGEGHSDWNLETGELYVSPRLLEICGYPPGTTFEDRADWVARFPFHPEDRPKWEKAVAAHMAGRDGRFDMEVRIVVDGETRWVRFVFLCSRDASGKAVRWTGSTTDITQRKSAAEALRLSEDRYARAMEGSDAGHWDWNIVTDEIFVSRRAREMLELPADTDRLPRTRAQLMALVPMHPDDRAAMQGIVETSLASGRHEREYRVIPRPGEVRWLRSRAKVYQDARGAAVRMTGSLVDITEPRLAADRLRESEARFRSLTELSSDFFWETDAEHRYTAIELGWAYRGVRNNASKIGLARWEIPYASPDEAAWAAHRATIAARERFTDFRFSRIENGEERFYEHSGEPRYDAQGTFLGYRGVGRDVTERQRAEAALAESEKRHERAMLAAEAGFWDWDVRADEYYVSPKLLEMTDFAPGTKFAGRADFMARAPFHPDDRVRFERAVKELFASGGTRLAMEMRSIHGNETRWALLSGMCVRDAAGKILRWTGSATDITARKRAEMALRQSEERYARVMQASEDGFWEWVVVTDEFYASPRMLAIYGLPPDTVFRGRKDFLTRFPFYPEDLESWRKAVAAHVAGETARVDLEVRVKLQGWTRWIHLTAVCLRDASGAEERWTGSVSDVTERRRAQEALRRSEAALRLSDDRYALALQAADEGHFDTDLHSGEMFVSARLNEIYGFGRRGKTVNRVEFLNRIPFHPDDRHLLAEIISPDWEDPARDLYEFECRIVPRPGETRWIHTRGKVTRDAEGRARRRVGVVADITERKRAEEALRLSEERYALAMEAAGDGHTDWNLETGEFYISPRLLEIVGHPPDATFADRADWVRRFPFHPEDRPKWEAAVAAHFAGREAKFRMDLRIVVNGETRWTAFTFIATRDASGRPVRWTGSIADINDAKLAEQALRESQERYARAVAGANDGIWDEDLTTRMLYRSPRNQEMVLGRPSDGIDVRSRAEWAQWHHVHPDDAPKRDAAIRAHVEGRTPLYEMEYRVRHPDGSYHWIHARGLCTRDASGRAVRIAGSTTNIDARKAAEEGLRASEERYELAMRASGEGHWDWKIATDEFYASPRYLELGGFPPDMAYSRRADIVDHIPFHPDDRARYEAAVAAHFAGETPRVDIVVRLVPHGEIRWVHVIGTCLRDADGKPVRWAGSVNDITARKLAEEALRLSEKRYALAMDVAEEGHFDWNVQTDEIFSSARALSVVGAPADGKYRTRSDVVAHVRYHPDDDERIRREWRAALDGPGVDHEFEYRILRGEAQEPRWIRGRWKVFRDAAGAALRVVGIVADITERKRAADGLRESEARFRDLTELSSDWYWEQDENLRFTYLSSQADTLTGYSGESSLGKQRWEIANMTPLTCSWAEHQAVLAARKPFRDLECRRVGPDGMVRYLSMSGAPIFDAEGRFRGYRGIGRNITERKRIEEELRSRQEMLELAQKSARAVAFEWRIGADGPDRNRWSPELEAMYGVAPGSYDGSFEQWRKLVHPEDWQAVKEAIEHATRTGEVSTEYRVVHPDSSVHWLQAKGRMFFDADGKPARMVGFMHNVTERKHIEEELRRSQHYLAEAQRLSHIGSWGFNAAGFGYWSPELFKIHGLDPGGKAPSIPEYVALVHPEDRDFVVQEIEKMLAGAHGFDFKKRIVRPDGEIRHVRCVGIRATTGRDEFVGSGMDVTEQERAEEELRKSEERFALAVEGSNEGIFDWDLASDRVYVSYRAQELFGLPRGELWRPRRDWRHILSFHPDDAPRLHDGIKAHIEGSAPTYDVEFRVVAPGGGVRWYRQRGIALRDASGKAYRVVGSIGDVTERHAAEEELKAMERKLRLAQRLEAMGTLAGGIAHDFNNILGAILGYGEMALRDAPKGSRLARDLDSIVVAGERGRALVDRVLAFSRSGVGERVPVHVEKVVREALDLVSAKLPPDITLHAKLHAGRAAMLGDATQVHQVLMNLASNGIQAMRSGGTLRVSLHAVRIDSPRAPTIGILDRGEYLALEVADSGTGIAPEILDRIFDPFFTTKEVGTGTGLGLSLVHGIVAEVGGAIEVSSKVGAGSTFTVYLPRSGEALDGSTPEEPEMPRGGGERVLVVDDEEALVKLATRTLEELGYAPVGFTSSRAALAAFRADPQRFDALITDERMPGLSGSALIREVRGIRDRIPIVLMSGYIGGTVATRAREAGAEEVLKKPLSARELAASLARVLQA